MTFKVTGFCLRCGETRPERAAYCPGCGAELTTASGAAPLVTRPTPASADLPQGERPVTLTGKVVALLGVVSILTGLFVGFGMQMHSIGVDGSSIGDLAAAHVVNCGSAFHADFRSVACEQALSSRRTAAWVLLVAGAALTLGAGAQLREPMPQESRGKGNWRLSFLR